MTSRTPSDTFYLPGQIYPLPKLLRDIFQQRYKIHIKQAVSSLTFKSLCSNTILK